MCLLIAHFNMDGAFREYTICMEGRPWALNLVFKA